jgi:very-short-patch-repair endonuclease
MSGCQPPAWAGTGALRCSDQRPRLRAPDLADVSLVSDLPPLTGSPILDPWRIRLRLELAGQLEQPQRQQQATPTERMLWQRLEHEPPGWYREYSTGLYRLDFYCPIARLAIEVDGGSHYGRKAAERDAFRDDWHRARGTTTKRFSVREVETDLDWVMSEIRLLLGRDRQTDGPGNVVPRSLAADKSSRVPCESAQETRSCSQPAAVPALIRSPPSDVRTSSQHQQMGRLQACLTVLPADQRRLLHQLARLFDT